jgi:hypothetical protein
MFNISQLEKDGGTPWNKGKKNVYSKETLRKMSLAKRGKRKPLSEETKKKISIANKGNKLISKSLKEQWRNKKRIGHPHTENTRERISNNLRGEKSYSWKGGITPIILRARHSFKYRQWRCDVFTRDNFTCQGCGKRGGYLEAHHHPSGFSELFYKNKIKTLEGALACEELWNINNGITLCLDCHNKTKK